MFGPGARGQQAPLGHSVLTSGHKPSSLARILQLPRSRQGPGLLEGTPNFCPPRCDSQGPKHPVRTLGREPVLMRREGRARSPGGERARAAGGRGLERCEGLMWDKCDCAWKGQASG